MSIALIIAIIAFSICILICIGAILGARRERARSRPTYSLTRHDGNPIISPLPIREWELNGTFNPAAFQDDEGKVHLLYRAIGADGLSRAGYASSNDGVHFSDRSMYPVFEHVPTSNASSTEDKMRPKIYNPAMYTSGGGWGGAEDPRTVVIDGRVYMSYVAFEGWDSVRIALTSIGLADFKSKRWNWRRPFFLSSPHEVNKNWLIFPEKINGKYAILHTIVPDVMIEYVDSLDYIPKFIFSPRPQGVQPGRKNFWDNRIRGSGPPPIKTEKGWLLLYHAIDKDDPHKYGVGYRVGAMLLDLNDPTKVLYRSPQPILNPEMHYENDGKPGVVYATGAVVIGDNLMIYYGGGDRHVCIAQTPLRALLDWLVTYGKV